MQSLVRVMTFLIALIALIAPVLFTGAEPLVVDPDSEAWGEYVVLSGRGVSVGQATEVGGNIHAGRHLDLARDVTVSGNASAELRVWGPGEAGVAGEVIEWADPVPLPALPPQEELRSQADRVLTGFQVLRDEVIDDVLFVEGRVEIAGSLNGRGTLIATRGIFIRRGPAQLESDTLLSIISYGRIDIGRDRSLRALIRAGKGMWIGRNAQIEGAVFADRRISLSRASTFVAIDTDGQAPSLDILEPVDGQVVSASDITVHLAFSDSGSGIDPATLSLIVDGVDRSAELQLSEGSASLDLASLAEGAHSLLASIEDQAGNLSQAASSFVVDTAAPSLSFLEPAEGTGLINISSPPISLAISEALPASGLRLVLDPDGAAIDLSIACSVAVDGAICASPPLSPGPHVLQAVATDAAGNTAQASVSFEILRDVAPPALTIDAPTATIYNEAAPTITLSFTDADTGVDPATVEVLVDGVATSGCQLRFDDGDAAAVLGADCPAPNLTDGAHTILARVSDRVGLSAEATGSFNLVLDSAPPTLAFLSPDAGTQVQADGFIDAVLELADPASGIDLTSFEFLIDGVTSGFGCDLSPIRAECRLPLTAGSYALGARVADRAGNTATAALPLELIIDNEAPVLEIVQPSADLPRGTTSTPIEVTFSDSGFGLDPATLSIRLDGRELVSTCTVGSGSASCEASALAEGVHTLVVRQADRAGSFARESRSFSVVFSDREPPSLEIVTPAGDRIVGFSGVELTYGDESGIAPETLIVRLDDDELSCDAQAESAFCAALDVPAGPHVITAEVRDTEGNRSLAESAFDLELQLPVVIDEPAAGALVRSGEISVRGSVAVVDGSELASVEVAGVAATLGGDGSFEATVVLHEGANQLTAVARSALGGTGTASVRVVKDTEAPRPVIRTPPDGLVTTAPQIVVAGDILSPTSSGTRQETSEVEVLGLDATVEQRAFVRENVLLVPGENPIEVLARDAAGNVGRDVVTVTYLPNPSRRLEELLGSGQRGRVGERLEKPLVVRAVDSFGTPLPGREVVFEVTRGDGQVTADPDSGRLLRVRTDVNGIAQVGFVLGRRSGEGNHEVTATSTGLEGALLFCASGDAVELERIVRIVGDTHLGALSAAADAEAPFPLRTQVFDALGNPLGGVPVTYRVREGSGFLRDASGDLGTEALVSTDAEGRALMGFVLGPEVGINSHRIEADFFGSTSLPAVFSITGVTPGPAAETRVAGQVLDNEDEPVPGATVRVLPEGGGDPLETLADINGRFEIAGAPVGTIDLEVDGTTTSRPGRWPVLHYVFDTISGHRNDIGMPVRLLPIQSGAIVGGAEDVTIPIDGVAGGELTVFAGSVTFPDGSKVGEVSVTQVHGDKVPMLPPMGSSFMLAWTVQPPGAYFDPPARISIPNMGDAPGAVVDIFSFDHDLGEFVPIGTATVSDDGTRVTSNRGSGVVKAGWHGCVPPPKDPTDVCQPSACRFCNDEGRLESRCDVACETCDDGTCTPRKVESLTVLGFGDDGEETGDAIVVGTDQSIDFSRRIEETCRSETYEWDFGDGETASGKTAEHAFEEPGVYTVTLTASCAGCDDAEVTDELDVRVIELDLLIRDLPEEGEENEESPGAFIVVNDDDDNDNETADLDESSQIQDEDDLVEAKIEFDRDTERGSLRLEAKNGGSSLLVWTSEDKEEQIELPKTWQLGDSGGGGEEPEEIPESVWVEAVDGSGELRDIELVLSYEDELLNEPVEDMVALTAIDLEFRVSPEFTRQELGKDEVNPIGIGAYVFFHDFEDPERLIPVADGTAVTWEVLEGGGSVEGEVSTESGFAPGIANLPETVGSVHQLRATVEKILLPEEYGGIEAETNIRRDTEEIEVIPGLPDSIELTSSGTTYLRDGVSEVEIEALVLDLNGEPVVDGTVVDWLFDGDAELVSSEPSTAGGRAKAIVVAPPSLDVSHFVTASAIDVEETTAIDVQPVTGNLTGSTLILDKSLGDTVTLELATNAGDGTSVEWSIANGELTSSVTSVQGGVASVVVSAANSALGTIRAVAVVGGQSATWEGTVVSSGDTSVITDERVLVADPSQTASAGLTLRSGEKMALPVSATSTIRGPANGFARVSLGGATLAEAFLFDAEADGAVAGEVDMRQIALGSAGSASIDSTEFHAGGASLLTDGTSPLVVDGPPVVFGQQEMLVSMWLRPQLLDAATLATQADLWSLELLADGRVQANVLGNIVTSNASVLPDVWVDVSLYAFVGGLRLNVGDDTVALTTAAANFASLEPVVLADGYIGHLDDLSFHTQAGGLEFVQLDGVDATGALNLDENGTATVTVRSRGTSLGYFEVESALLQVTTAATQDALASAGDFEKADLDLILEVIKITSIESFIDLVDLLDAATGGDPDEIQDWVAALVGGFFAVADVGALIREGLKLAGVIDGNPSAFIAVLSLIGIVTAVNPVVDGVISALRPIVREVGGEALERFLFETIKEFVGRGFRFVGNQLSFLRGLTSLPLSTVGRLGRSLSFQSWVRMAKVHARLGDDIFEAAARSIDEVEGGAEAFSGMLRWIDELEDAGTYFRQAQEAGQLTNMLKQMTTMIAERGVPAEIMVRVVQNCKNICNDTAYPVWQMIDDLIVVGDSDGFVNFVSRLRAGSQTADPNYAGRALGNRYELEVASACIRRDGGSVRFLAFAVDTPQGRTDIDVLWEAGADSVLYQAKRGSLGTVAAAEQFVNRAKAWLKQEGLDLTVIQYVVPDLSKVGPKMRNRLEDILDSDNVFVPEFSAPGPAGQ